MEVLVDARAEGWLDVTVDLLFAVLPLYCILKILRGILPLSSIRENENSY